LPLWAWLLLALLSWIVVALVVSLATGRFLTASRLSLRRGQAERPPAGDGEAEPTAHRRLLEVADASWPAGGGDLVPRREQRRILVIDDDPALRLLLRTTLAADEFAVEEAVSAEEASDLVRLWRPAVVILDVGLPGVDGLTFCAELKDRSKDGAPLVVLLTGADLDPAEVELAGADAVLRKPFSPLELVALLDRVSEPRLEFPAQAGPEDAEQLLIYARDLGRLLERERAQRRLLQQGYRQTATALADALEAKDPVTGLHALRVQRYALELTAALDSRLLDDPSLEYGFLLHDVGKIGIPDAVLGKQGPLSEPERRLIERHTLVGVEILADVAPLRGEGLRVVRSHHERWDGNGYPDGLAGDSIPLAARVFALVDALDAMTSERPYRPALPWDDAVDEILAQSGGQFDPRVVAAFAARERRMRRISRELAEQAA
jgi:response regulator RpfG family c-di-GMP phosphodiesterase